MKTTLKKQIEALVKAAAIAGLVAFFQALDADAPDAWVEQPYWPIIGAALTYVIHMLKDSE